MFLDIAEEAENFMVEGIILYIYMKASNPETKEG